LRDGYSCRVCGRVSRDLLIDHIMPLHLGGRESDDNRQALCSECHQIKSDREAADRATGQIGAMEGIMKTPVILVDNDIWSMEAYVMFDDDNIEEMIPSECIEDAYLDDGNGLTREEILAEMVDEFQSENSTVDEFWPEKMVLRTDNKFYRYSEDGMVRYLRGVSAITDLDEED